MTELRFYNSLTKRVEPFQSKERGKVRMYNCGPTVYKRPHLGNMRRFLFADFLRRSLEYFGYEVRDITNITDVGHLTQDDIDAGEDKLEKTAKEQKRTPAQIAEQVTQEYFQDLSALNIQPAHLYPRATQHIPEMIEITKALLARGHAYQTPSGIYFDVKSFPEYGKLSGNTLEKIAAGARVEVREEKRHPADFALWKLNDPTHLQQWDSPWGKGYPGWHIECSAMSMKYLDSEIDIHTGGEDNRFPHHENEIAQSEGATGKPFVRLWMHNAFLKLQGQKLAKRAGEQLTVDSLKEKGFSPLAFRLLVFGGHYRTPLDFSWEAMHQAQKNLDSIKQLLRRLKEVSAKTAQADEKTILLFSRHIADDLNTPSALAALLNFISVSNSMPDSFYTSPDFVGEVLATLRRLDKVVGVVAPLEAEIEGETIPEEIKQLAEARET
ncbi:MAG: cysteine--tRNA ligase, partial [Patescibacteria group bacterium]